MPEETGQRQLRNIEFRALKLNAYFEHNGLPYTKHDKRTGKRCDSKGLRYFAPHETVRVPWPVNHSKTRSQNESQN